MPSTYFTVFAGRRRYLSVLMVYVQPLVEQHVVDHVHLWDYTRLPSDREYLSTLAGPSVHVIPQPTSDRGAKFPNKWKGYYAHYATLLAANDILIKCDDDVVFVANLPVLLKVLREDKGAHLLYYPSVVNNDVAAAFQAADGVITDPEYVVGLRASVEEGRFSRTPMSDWFNCTHCAEHVHSKFLARPESFFTGCLHEWHTACRVPINFFAMRGDAVRRHFSAYASEQYVDEPYFTSLLTERTRMPSLLVSDVVVVHFSFGFQHMAAERELLERYRRLSRDQALHARLREAYGSRSLSRSCPSAAPSDLLQGRRQRPYPNVTGRGAGRGGRGAGRGLGSRGHASRSGAHASSMPIRG